MQFIFCMIVDEMSVLTIHKKSDDGLSDEMSRICTGPWGLQSILREFETYMSDIFGVEQMQILKLFENRWNFDELMQRFLSEYFRKDIISGSDNIRIYIPDVLLENTIATKGETICFSKQVQVHFGYGIMRFNKDEFVKVGEKTLRNIIKQIKTVLAGETADVETIILCGNLSKSVVVQTALIECFNTKRVVVLDEMYKCPAAINGAICVER